MSEQSSTSAPSSAKLPAANEAVASTNESLHLNGSAAATVKQNAHKVSGRDWKAPKQPVRKQRTQLTSYEERRRQDAERQAVAKVEKEMKAEKAAEKQRCVLSLSPAAA